MTETQQPARPSADAVARAIAAKREQAARAQAARSEAEATEAAAAVAQADAPAEPAPEAPVGFAYRDLEGDDTLLFPQNAPTQSRAVRAKNAARKTGTRAKEKAYEKTPERFKNASGLQVRFRTGFVYVAVSVVAVLVNDVTTMLYLALVSAVCAGEFYYMMRADSKLPNELIGVIGAAAYPVFMWWMGSIGIVVVTVGLMMALFVWYVYWMHARVADVAVSLFGAMYTGLLMSMMIPVRQALPQPWGGVLLLVLFCSVWFNDAGAYLVGSKFGRHKLAPLVSPKKSWEGFIAGLVVSAAFWCLMVFIPGVSMAWWQAIVFGVVSGAAGVLGDLTESRIKRNVGVKDSGTIMPGHGGLLDRCDSLFFCSVVGALLLFGGMCVPLVW